tara:strand:+ start:327 stop:1448 length:1122 start_codon:yes stop_codon:yes gene_type:complete
MPPSAKRSRVATQDKHTKNKKITKRKTITHVPKWAEDLTDVVAAFEDLDDKALREALDAANPLLLNHHPKLWLPGEFHGLNLQEGANRKQCFFNASPNSCVGCRPLSLLSSATYMLAGNWTSRHSLAREKKVDRDYWTGIYRVLVCHPKIDVNAYIGENTEYMTFNRDGPVNPRPGPFFHPHPSGQSKDDGMRAWDYACAIRDRYRGVECNCNSAYARNLISILIESGKLKPTGKDLIDIFMLAMPSKEPATPAYYEIEPFGSESAETRDFLNLLRQAEIPALRELVEVMEKDLSNLSLLHFRRHFCGSFLIRVMRQWKKVRRNEVLRHVRNIARAHIIAARWWAISLETSYAPGGDGFVRAQTSFKNASESV